MRTPRGESGSPDELPIQGGGGASTDRLYDLAQTVSSLEKSVTYLEAHADDTKKKLETISNDIVEAKATFKTVKFLFVALVTGTWGVLGTIIVFWLKHHFGW